jgi:hypothetical protein
MMKEEENEADRRFSASCRIRRPVLISILLIQIAVSLLACAGHKIHSENREDLHTEKASQKGVYHVVERHQTLYRICLTYKVDIHEVLKLNRITQPGIIRTGQRIFIPRAERILKVEIHMEDVASEAVAREREMPGVRPDFLWPLTGRMGSLFEAAENRRHLGVDILSPSGTPVRAAASGVVLYSGNGIRGYGNLVILRHSDEFVTVYAHNETNLVDEGGRVEKGQVIANVGKTGNASGPHLHFEIRKNNQAVDPLPLLNYGGGGEALHPERLN